MPRATWISVVAFLVSAACANAQDGRLQRMRDDINSPTTSNSGGGTSSDSSDGGSGCAGDATGALVGLAVATPFYLPVFMLNDRYEHPLPFTPHPYADGYCGYQIMYPDWANVYYDVDTSDILRKAWAVRVQIEDGNDFAGINRLGGQLKIEHESRFGILTNWNFYRENLGNGRSDATVIGDTNLTVRFAQNEMASMYTGVGFRTLTDHKQTDYGFNFVYGGDWFPIRPFIGSFQIDAGWLGEAGVFHVRASVGAIWQGVEAYAGYDFLRIGTVNLQGPMAGVRFWF